MTLLAGERPAERASAHDVTDNILHGLDFVSCRCAFLAGVPHDTIADRRVADQRAGVDARRLSSLSMYFGKASQSISMVLKLSIETYPMWERNSAVRCLPPRRTAKAINWLSETNGHAMKPIRRMGCILEAGF